MNRQRLEELRRRPHTISQAEVRQMIDHYMAMKSGLDRIAGAAHLGPNAGVAAINIAVNTIDQLRGGPQLYRPNGIHSAK